MAADALSNHNEEKVRELMVYLVYYLQCPIYQGALFALGNTSGDEREREKERKRGGRRLGTFPIVVLKTNQ